MTFAFFAFVFHTSDGTFTIDSILRTTPTFSLGTKLSPIGIEFLQLFIKFTAVDAQLSSIGTDLMASLADLSSIRADLTATFADLSSICTDLTATFAQLFDTFIKFIHLS